MIENIMLLIAKIRWVFYPGKVAETPLCFVVIIEKIDYEKYVGRNA